MRSDLKQNILEVLRDSFKAINKNDIVALKELSNHIIHKASTLQDEYSTSIAVISYALSKIFERAHYRDYKDWNKFYNTCMTNLKNAIVYLEKNDTQEYEASIKNIFNVIDRLSSNLKRYTQEVIEKARIHRASRIHEHGISVERTAKLLGISQWELMEYIGKTGISDTELSITKTVADRLKFTRSIFK
ncbi:MAG: hypothetical protein AB1571_01295 [Nanoarchaeota archaeon]